MGGAVSAGADNDELTDNLCSAEYIRTPHIEKLFRCVDRGEYILPEYRTSAYKDQAWRSNHFHLSAPCIYSQVLEGLGLAPGMSFLNLGSGTGYLSTLAGLILGCNGVNHGVEYWDDVIQYANKKLEDFKKYSGAMDEFDFCEPKFMQGNCLCLTADRRYDRVYVGAACPVPFDSFLKNFVKVGGILIMPMNDQLLQCRRTSENNWETSQLLPVSFANLIMPKEDYKGTYDMIELHPDSLQSICRSRIRNILRTNVQLEHPELCRPAPRKPPKKPKTARRHVLQVFNGMFVHDTISLGVTDNSSDDSEAEPEYAGRIEILQYPPEGDPNSNEAYVLASARIPMGNESASASESETMECDSTVPDPIVESSGVEEQMDTAQGSSSGDVSSTDNKAQRNIDSGLGDDESDEEVASQDQNDIDNHKQSFTFRRFRLEENNHEESQDGSGESEEDDGCVTDPSLLTRRTIDSPYTPYMCDKIHELPLPPSLKSYLNYYRFHLNVN